jgi:hypothetical protein
MMVSTIGRQKCLINVVQEHFLMLNQGLLQEYYKSITRGLLDQELAIRSPKSDFRPRSILETRRKQPGQAQTGQARNNQAPHFAEYNLEDVVSPTNRRNKGRFRL